MPAPKALPRARRRDLHPSRVVTRAFVRAVGRRREEGAPAIGGLRRRVVLAAVFRVMPRQVDRRRASRHDAVIEWRIRDGTGAVDIWTLTLDGGRCSTRRGGAERPRTRIEVDTGDFLALVTGNADGFALWSTGRLQVEGDVIFAATLGSMFRVPRHRAAPAHG